MSLADFPQSDPLSAQDALLARSSSQQLGRLVDSCPLGNSVQLEVHIDGSDPAAATVAIPLSAFQMLADILKQMAQGHAVTVIPLQTELSTQQVAEILNVSRPFVIKLIDESQLPCRLVGTHRRVLLSDVLEYKRRIDGDRLKVLQELSDQAQELKMGY